MESLKIFSFHTKICLIKTHDISFSLIFSPHFLFFLPTIHSIPVKLVYIFRRKKSENYEATGSLHVVIPLSGTISIRNFMDLVKDPTLGEEGVLALFSVKLDSPRIPISHLPFPLIYHVIYMFMLFTGI